MTDFTAPPARIFAGTVGKGHGLDGSFYVVGAVPDLLAKGTELWVGAETEPRTVERRAGTADKPIVRLSGSVSRNDADSFRGLALEASNEDAPQLGDDEYWAHQLVGCVVSARGDGRVLGEVVELMALPSCEVLVVRAPERAAALAEAGAGAGAGAGGEGAGGGATGAGGGTNASGAAGAGGGKPAGPDDLLVPMVKDAIVEIDPEGRRVVVDAEFLALDEG